MKFLMFLQANIQRKFKCLIIFVILYWLTVITIIHKRFSFYSILFHLDTRGCFDQINMNQEKENTLNNSMSCPRGDAPATLWQGRVLRGRVLRGPTFTRSSCLQGRVLWIPLLRFEAELKSEAGTKICLYLAH